MMNVECSSEALGEVEAAFRFNDAVLRTMTVRRNEAVTETSLILQAKEKEDAREAERRRTPARETSSTEKPESAAEQSPEATESTPADTDAPAPAEAATEAAPEQ